jgi:hypothetical protein
MWQGSGIKPDLRDQQKHSNALGDQHGWNEHNARATRSIAGS